MALYTVTQNSNINALDVSQIVAELQRAGGTQESQNYFLAGGLWTTSPTNSFISLWVTFRSRNATPSSVTINTNMQAPSGNIGAPSTSNLTASGFQIFAAGFGLSAGASCGGTWVASF